MIFETNKSLFILVAIILLHLKGFSATEVIPDTTIRDLTGNFLVKIPLISNDIQDFQVAVIPLDSIGKKKLLWNSNQQQFTTETEEEFERELISCSQGRDSSRTQVNQKNNYCKKSGYGDQGMGKSYDVNYISYVRTNKLIVIEFAVVWRNCIGFFEGDDRKKCISEEKEKMTRIDKYTDELVDKLFFRNAD